MSEQTIILPPNPSGNGHDANYRITVFAPKRRFLSYLLDRWWVVLICVLLLAGAAVVYDTLQPETYTSVAQLYLSGDVQMGVAGQVTEDSRNYFGTQIELLKSSRLQQAAYQAAGGPPNGSLKKLADLDVVQPMGTSLLRLRVTGSGPRFAQAFLKALVDEYQTYKKETRNSTSGDVVELLNTQLSKQKDLLQAEQDRYADFVRSNDLAVLQEESRIKGLYLNDLSLKLDQFKLDYELRSNGLGSIENSGINLGAVGLTSNLLVATPATNVPDSINHAGPSSAGAILTDALIADNPINPAHSRDGEALKEARQRLEELKIAEATVLKNPGGKADARMQKFPERISEAEQIVKLREDQDRADQQSDLEALGKRIAAMEARLPALKTNLDDIYERLSQAQRINYSVQREQASFDDLRATLKRVDLGRNMEQERLSVLDPASPAQPTRHLLALWVALAVLAGLAAGAGIVFVWQLLDDRFSSISDVKDQFGEMLLGMVPQVQVSHSQPREALLQEGDVRHGYVESFRHLRSALLLSAQTKTPTKTLLITSAGPGEGKTTVAANLACTLARSGLRVALIDADPHGGGLHRLFETPESPGIFDFLRGEASMQNVAHCTAIDGLLLVPRGVFHPHTDGLFLRPKLSELIQTLRQDRDFIILDGAPMLATDDAALLAPHADSVIIVVRPLFTRARLLRRTLDMLYHRQAKQVAIVLNRARADDMAGKYAMNGRASNRKNGASKLNGKSNGKINPPPRTPVAS